MDKNEKNSLFLFSQSCYKHHFRYAIQAVLVTYKNRGVKQINYEIFKKEIYMLADILTQEWIDREKEAKKLLKNGTNNNIN
ncbi:MAG: hypothetical protein AABY22_18300 [Nanoarchaeota archaeon]